MTTKRLRLAHLSDLHVSGRSEPRHRLERALGRAHQAGADHLLLTGDLTDRSRDHEFDELCQLLQMHWPKTATLVPGNHDAAPGAFERAIDKLPARFQTVPVVTDEVVVLPVDTRRRLHTAPLFWATGRIGREQAQAMDVLTDYADRPVVLAMHHGPHLSPLYPFEGLLDRKLVYRLLSKGPHVHVCCGHEHSCRDVPPRIHVAASVVDSPDPLRLYDCYNGELTSTNAVN